MKYVITSGPSAGKTTQLEDIASIGIEVVPEAATQIIEEQDPGGILPWTDLLAFQKLVYDRQSILEQRITSNIAVLDRSKIDGIGYCTEAGIDVPEYLRPKSQEYDLVFFLERLPFYVPTKVRRESLEKAKRLDKYLFDAYVSCGYVPNKTLITVPYFEGSKEESAKKRTDFILEHVEVYCGSR